MIINTSRKKIFIKTIFNFIYYLRYLILIFIFSIILVFSIPKLFKHVNKINELNHVLKNHHGFIIKNSDKIKYKIFPKPNLVIKNPIIFIGKKYPVIKIKELTIFVNIKSLYVPNKIIFKKIKFKGNFLGNNIKGYYIPKKNENYIYFKVENLGIESKIFLDNKKKIPKTSGVIKFKILDDNFLINFNFDKNLQLENSIYKSENIYTDFNGQFNFEPFFYFKIFANIKKVNLENLKLKQFYNQIIEEISNKKLNGELNIKFLTQKTKENKMNILFKNGNIISEIYNFKFANLNIAMNLNLRRYPSYKNMDYEMSIKTDNINKFYKIIGLKKNINDNKINISIKGNINLDAQKYYFKEITINKKNLEEKKMIRLKNYLDKNALHFPFNEISKKNIYSIFKDLFEFI